MSTATTAPLADVELCVECDLPATVDDLCDDHAEAAWDAWQEHLTDGWYGADEAYDHWREDTR